MKKFLILIIFGIFIVGCHNSVSSNDNKITNIYVNDYGSGSACGGSIMSFNEKI